MKFDFLQHHKIFTLASALEQKFSSALLDCDLKCRLFIFHRKLFPRHEIEIFFAFLPQKNFFLPQTNRKTNYLRFFCQGWTFLRKLRRKFLGISTTFQPLSHILWAKFGIFIKTLIGFFILFLPPFKFPSLWRNKAFISRGFVSLRTTLQTQIFHYYNFLSLFFSVFFHHIC